MNRSAAFAFVALVLAVVALGATAAPARSAAHSEKQLYGLNKRIASAINDFRTAHGLAPLTISDELNAAATQHSDEMGSIGYFNHPSANGTAFWKRIQTYYSSSSYSYWTVGENLLWSTPSVGATQALQMWVASPEHLRNLLSKDWQEIGISSVHVVHAGGVYHGKTVTIITTDFGARH